MSEPSRAPEEEYSQLLEARDEEYRKGIATRKPLAERTNRDELLFLATHHTTELWLEVVAEDLEVMSTLISQQRLAEAVHLMKRDSLIIVQVTESLSILEQLSPWDYVAIKRGLRDVASATGVGSGGDSPAFRAVRSLTRVLRKRWNELLAARGIRVADIYQRRTEFSDLYALAEALIEWDEKLMLWRDRHFHLVNRIIGSKGVGTAGMTVQQLGQLLNNQQFPELWEVRNELTVHAES